VLVRGSRLSLRAQARRRRTTPRPRAAEERMRLPGRTGLRPRMAWRRGESLFHGQLQRAVRRFGPRRLGCGPWRRVPPPERREAPATRRAGARRRPEDARRLRAGAGAARGIVPRHPWPRGPVMPGRTTASPYRRRRTARRPRLRPRGHVLCRLEDPAAASGAGRLRAGQPPPPKRRKPRQGAPPCLRARRPRRSSSGTPSR
jgi:hypothetical protein